MSKVSRTSVKADDVAARKAEKAARPWYRKKRWIAAMAFGLLIVLAATSSGDDGDSQTTVEEQPDPGPEPIGEVKVAAGDPCNAETGEPGPGEGLFERDIDGGLSCVAQPEEQAPPPEPQYDEPRKRDWEVTLEVTDRECFGSAGCNVGLRPELTYAGDDAGNLDPAITYELRYEVRGTDDGTHLKTLTITGDEWEGEELYVSTPGEAPPTAHVVSFKERGF